MTPGTRLLGKRALREGPQASEEMREGNHVDHATCLALRRPFCLKVVPGFAPDARGQRFWGHVSTGTATGQSDRRDWVLGVLWSQGQGQRWGGGRSCDFRGRGTHGDEHDDGEGVVHGVSAHGPPRQLDHLRTKGCQLLLAREMGGGSGYSCWGGLPPPPGPTGTRPRSAS